MPKDDGHSRVIRAGWMTKKNVGASVLGDNWKTRYFILQKSGHLTYFAKPPFEDSTSQNQKGQVLIGPRTTTESIPKNTFQRENVLRIKATHWKFRHNVRCTEKKIGDLYVQASTADDAEKWLSLFKSFTRRRRHAVATYDEMDVAVPNSELDMATIDMLAATPENAERVSDEKLKKRGLKAFEVVQTEEKYLRDLKLCMSVYHDAMVEDLAKQEKKAKSSFLQRLFSRKKRVCFSADDVTALFGHLGLLIKFSEQLLEDLIKTLPKSVRSSLSSSESNAKAFAAMSEKETTELCLQMAAVFVKYTPFMLFYQGYANNFDTSQATLRRLSKHSSFKEFLMAKMSESDDLMLADFLIKPIQRLLRYKLLLRDMLKLTDVFHADHDELSLAILKLEVVAAAVDNVTSKHGHEKLNERSTDDIHALIRKKQLLHSASSRHIMMEGSQSRRSMRSPALGKSKRQIVSVDKSRAPSLPPPASDVPVPPTASRPTDSTVEDAVTALSDDESDDEASKTADISPPSRAGKKAPRSENVPLSAGKTHTSNATSAVVVEEAVHALSLDVEEENEEASALAATEEIPEAGRRAPRSTNIGKVAAEKAHTAVSVPATKSKEPRAEKKISQTSATATEPVKRREKINRHTESDGTVVEQWPDDRIVRRSPNGDTHTTFQDGTVRISNRAGASRTTRTDGSWVQIDADGTEVRQYADGLRAFKMPSGQTVMNYPDGSRVQTNVDGTIITLRTDGVQVAMLPNGVVNTKYPDGHVVQIEPDGTKVERLVEGVVVTYTPEGIVIARFKDGRVVQKNVDGVTLTTFPDGRVEQMSIDGRFLTTKTPDGKVTTVRVGKGVLGSEVDDLLEKDIEA